MTVTAEDSSVGSLEDNAAKRKERLAALKRKLQKDPSNEGHEDKDGDESLPAPIFRSYKPQAPELQDNALDTEEPKLIEDQIQDSLAAGEETTMIDELDITNLAPRKPDWDLKRDIAKKLEKLEKRTARAIGEIIRERLKANDDEEDLASAVQAGASYAAQSNEDD